jgi:hypothetical protein
MLMGNVRATIGKPMRKVVVAMIILGLTVPAYAQGMGGKRHRGSAVKSEQRKPKADEKASKAALDKLPDKKFDPWGTVREMPQPK